jgi:mannose-6-phosphate isomerase-like protein (cupin superfamily)
MPRRDAHTLLNRRELVTAIAGAAALGAVAPVAAAETTGNTAVAGDTAVRRLVTVRGADGRNEVLADGEPPVSFDLNGTRITRLWETAAVPARLPVGRDASLDAGSAYRAGFAGTSFYLAEIPPGVGRSQVPFHRNATIDYMAILRGEIYFVLPEKEFLLKQGDTLVQCGNDHTWENRGTEPCQLLFVVVPAVTG